MTRMRLCFCALAVICVASAVAGEAIVGNVRLQSLSRSILRLEQRGPAGFEDRKTFFIRSRNVDSEPILRTTTESGVELRVRGYRVVVPRQDSLKGVEVFDRSGRSVYRYEDALPKASYLPAPGRVGDVYATSDSPRLVPPPWGATPIPAVAPFDPELVATSGWDTRNDAPDIYLFLTPEHSYASLVSDYLGILGRTPLPPTFTFGLWDSRYYPYRQQEALDTIDRYRSRGFPLDLFVVDTDWRIGASKGYGVNTALFPDMAGFLSAAHGRGVRIMFNDHPEPQTSSALDPKETAYRWNGHTGLMAQGVDVWWFDRNWSTSLHEPMPGIKKELWGMAVFQDIAKRFRPSVRPLIMSNVQGVDNGDRNYPSQPGAHRYPIQWTGDTGAYWSYLEKGVRNGVDLGLLSLLAYVNEDLGGHWAHPSNELYVRYLQYGAFSPVMRIHCTAGETRYPWEFGAEAEQIVKQYVRMRYALLPTIYSAARRNSEDGTPILRRCDLEWPGLAGADDSTQYLFGDDLLVAPIITSKDAEMSPAPGVILSHDGEPGLRAEYFKNEALTGEPALTRIDRNIDFEWKVGSPDASLPSDGFSARWTGELGPMPESGDYVVGANADDGVRIWIGGKLVVDKWVPQFKITTTKEISLEKGKRYPIKVEYFERSGGASISMLLLRPSQRGTEAKRTIWIPPGVWLDRWTSERFIGPKTISVAAPLWKLPMFVREGGIVMGLSSIGRSSSPVWTDLTLDVCVPTRPCKVVRTLYEDDGESNAYLGDQYGKTSIRLTGDGRNLKLAIMPRQGRFEGAPSKRMFRIRLHGGVAANFSVVGTRASKRVYTPDPKYGWGEGTEYVTASTDASVGIEFNFMLRRRG